MEAPCSCTSVVHQLGGRKVVFSLLLFYLAYVAVFPLPFRQARVARGHGDRGNKKTETGGRGEGY